MLQLVIDRLNVQVPDFKGRVAGAAHLAAALGGLVVPPIAFVMLSGEVSEPNGLITALSQRAQVRFGVVQVVRNVADVRGATASTELEPLRAAVMVALLNWQPSTAYEPIQHGSGKLDNYDNQTLWWVDEFTTAIYRRA